MGGGDKADGQLLPDTEAINQLDIKPLAPRPCSLHVKFSACAAATRYAKREHACTACTDDDLTLVPHDALTELDGGSKHVTWKENRLGTHHKCSVLPMATARQGMMDEPPPYGL